MNDKKNGKIKLTEAEFAQLKAESDHLRRLNEMQTALKEQEQRSKERIALLKDAIIERNEGSKVLLPGIVVAETVKMDYEETEAFQFIKDQPELWAQYFSLNKDALLALIPFVMVNALRPDAFFQLNKRQYEAQVGRGALPDAPQYSTTIEDQVRVSVSSLLLHDELMEAIEIVEDEIDEERLRRAELEAQKEVLSRMPDDVEAIFETSKGLHEFESIKAPESVENGAKVETPAEPAKTPETGTQRENGANTGIPSSGKESAQDLDDKVTFLSDEEKKRVKDEIEAKASEEIQALIHENAEAARRAGLLPESKDVASLDSSEEIPF